RPPSRPRCRPSPPAPPGRIAGHPGQVAAVVLACAPAPLPARTLRKPHVFAGTPQPARRPTTVSPPQGGPGRLTRRRLAGQPASMNASRRYSCTAFSGTRNERPTRTAVSSPERTSRYTVILDTRIRAATWATVRTRTSARAGSERAGPEGTASFRPGPESDVDMPHRTFGTCRAAGFPSDGQRHARADPRVAGLL